MTPTADPSPSDTATPSKPRPRQVALYDQLTQLDSFPIVAVNRAVAIAELDGRSGARPHPDRPATPPDTRPGTPPAPTYCADLAAAFRMWIGGFWRWSQQACLLSLVSVFAGHGRFGRWHHSR